MENTEKGTEMQPEIKHLWSQDLWAENALV